jgi:hypothetical protein
MFLCRISRAATLTVTFCLLAGGCDLLPPQVRQDLVDKLIPQPGRGPEPSPPAGGGTGAGGSPGSSCVGAGVGSAGAGGSACQTPGEWKQAAYDDCTRQKLILVDIKYNQPCGGDLFAGMEYQCCGTTPGGPPAPPPPPVDPPPPSPACFGGVLDDGPTCVAGDQLKARASAICESKSFLLTGLGFGGECEGGKGFVGAKYECCAPAAPSPGPPAPPPMPPSTPGGACRKASEGGSTSCKDSATWKTYATAGCAADGFQLRELQLREPCGPDLYRFSDSVCCGP